MATLNVPFVAFEITIDSEAGLEPPPPPEPPLDPIPPPPHPNPRTNGANTTASFANCMTGDSTPTISFFLQSFSVPSVVRALVRRSARRYLPVLGDLCG